MHTTVDILKFSQDNLKVQKWTFILLDSKLVLDSYSLSKKASKRHSFKITLSYSRLRHRESSLSVEEVPFSDNIQQSALNELMKKITVCLQY